jgi:N-methylhydantoinase B/oxoprolinase/acetone carboxylase alpha subunit
LANETIEPSASIDPVTHEIIQRKLLSVVDEMAIVMTKTSMIPVVYEVLDFTCGICKSDQRFARDETAHDMEPIVLSYQRHLRPMQ